MALNGLGFHIPSSPQSNDLTLRLIMQGKEVGSIIGKKGDNIKKFREESGAKINISDGSAPERIVSITGSVENSIKALALIVGKFHDDLQGCGVVSLRLIVPASQCGSLIGKGGAKIKDIREATGASVQVSSEMLPHSTERTVTVSGNADAIVRCLKQICVIIIQYPPKGPTIPYRPSVLPVLFSPSMPYAPTDLTKVQHLALPLMPATTPQVWATMAAVQSPPTTAEMSISNELIGCVIGKGGIKINEIRQLSGAVIKVSNTEEGSKERSVTITGTPTAVNCAQYLINANIQRHRALEASMTLAKSPLNPFSLQKSLLQASLQGALKLRLALKKDNKFAPY